MNKLVSQRFWTDDAPWHFEFRNPQVPYPLHSHNFYELVFVYSGSGMHMLSETKSAPLKAGDVICVKPGQVHGYSGLENLVLMNLLIRPEFFSEHGDAFSNIPGGKSLFSPQLSKTVASEPSSFTMNKMQLFEARALIEGMQKEVSELHIGWELGGSALLFQLLLLLLRVYHDPKYPDTAEKNNVIKLIKYVEKNYAQKVTMQDLSEQGNMSESSVQRAFKRITGYPPLEYQMRQRMFAAIDKLIYTDWDITQIAYDVGFNDSNYFSRYFKKFINMTPSEYRLKFREQN